VNVICKDKDIIVKLFKMLDPEYISKEVDMISIRVKKDIILNLYDQRY